MAQDENRIIMEEQDAVGTTATDGMAVLPGKKRRIDSKYWKIGLVVFVVVVCSILFYFLFFKDHTLFGFLSSIWENILPFVWGAVLAYLLKPICNIFEKWFHSAFKKMKNRHHAHKLERKLAVAATILVFLLLLYVLFAAIIPQVIDSAKTLISNFPGYAESFFSWLEKVTEGREFQANIKDLHADVSALFSDTTESSLVGKMTNWLYTYIEGNYNQLMTNITSSIVSVVTVFKNILVAFMACIYILALRRKLGAQGVLLVHSIFPEKAAKKVMEEIHYIDKMFSGFINGKILDSIIIGILCYIVLRIFNVPYPLLVSVVVGVTNIIPFFGPFLGAIPCAFIILIVSPVKCLTFIIIILVLQQLDGNVIGPKIIGENTGVSSFWVLFAIVVFGGLWGFVGMIVGVPVFAVIYDLIRQLVQYGLSKKNKSDMYEVYAEKERAEEQEKADKKEAKREKRRKRVEKIVKKKKKEENSEK